MPTLVLIHIGEQWPPYLNHCVKQARLMNPSSVPNGNEIVLLVNRCHTVEVTKLQELYQIKVVFLEELQPSELHREFSTQIVSMVDLQFRKKYWQYVFERFFFLEEYVRQTASTSVYMIETDNMLYVPLHLLQTSETLFSQGMAAPFDNLQQGYPSLMFFRTPTDVTKFITYMVQTLRTEYLSDMKILSKYRHEHPEDVFTYPVLPHSANTPLRARFSQAGHSATASETQFLSDPKFLFVFDAIAFGQALGGIDPRNTNGLNTVGYVNESALYSVHETEFSWMKLHGLWFPMVNQRPLVNLHIHSKGLSAFLSDQEQPPGANYDPKQLMETLL